MTRLYRHGAVAIDLLALVAFVVIGRAAHHHGETVEGFLSTAWPFAAGLGIGWALVLVAERFRRFRQISPASLPGGVVVCAVTVATGMALRVLAGQGTALAFIAVATGFFGAAMLGGRTVASVASRRLARAGGARSA
jgi:hypothetical protein